MKNVVRSQTEALGSQVVLLTSDAYNEHAEDLYCLLPATDALITDYSSVYFDYLLLNRPIGFVVDDLEHYRRQRGFLLEPVERWMPGEHFRSVNDLEGFIRDVAAGRDPYRGHRNGLSEMFFPAGIQDTAACSRTILKKAGTRMRRPMSVGTPNFADIQVRASRSRVCSDVSSTTCRAQNGGSSWP